ncbi:hypothetical protein LJB68_13845 [bacterium 210820-DFI.6.52]|uniref:Uncharacterized protein n=1 Tax=Bittarella massiliensis (ex Durand et al. 2017) TaxID=1720313 RepID=A0AAQ1MFP9_9FIRM|nr:MULTISPECIES: hypothetical protein [Eubacteriales]ERJ00832.1 hypothetical protein HMPREF0262_00421 [Clostridium sp. ATCC 29733]MCB5942612.1 hypothetical protein [bacterium 210820-DFI.6.52]SHG51701.1 hypothetical protein SAMN05444424_2631 [Bittarella massiliensis (ex Durand et al. 2017)]
MATKSITKDVYIKDKALCRGLIRALESAEKKSAQKVIFSKKVTEAKGDQIKELFGDK